MFAVLIGALYYSTNFIGLPFIGAGVLIGLGVGGVYYFYNTKTIRSQLKTLLALDRRPRRQAQAQIDHLLSSYWTVFENKIKQAIQLLTKK